MALSGANRGGPAAVGQSAASQNERLRRAGPGSRVNQVGEVSRLICLGISRPERADADWDPQFRPA